MRNCLHFLVWRTPAFRRLGADDRASQIVEFALSLPLLVLFVVGIFDFSEAHERCAGVCPRRCGRSRQ
jgi:Flp pilus assembly protein TadG